jgi:flagellar motor protein MotB
MTKQGENLEFEAEGDNDQEVHEHEPAGSSLSRWSWGYLLLVIEGLLLVLVCFYVSLAIISFLGLLKPFRIGPTAYTVKIQDPDVQTTAPLEEAVFFQNGDWALSGESKRLLTVVAKLTDCPGGAVKVTPWVSSAEYKNDPDGTKNYDLAKRRGKAVTEFLTNENPALHVSGKGWGSFGDIRSHLFFKDARSDPHKESSQEQFNRRVDIRIEMGCSPPM